MRTSGVKGLHYEELVLNLDNLIVFGYIKHVLPAGKFSVGCFQAKFANYLLLAALGFKLVHYVLLSR